MLYVLKARSDGSFLYINPFKFYNTITHVGDIIELICPGNVRRMFVFSKSDDIMYCRECPLHKSGGVCSLIPGQCLLHTLKGALNARLIEINMEDI